MREYGADVGIALDGDGDRIIMADNRRNFLMVMGFYTFLPTP